MSLFCILFLPFFYLFWRTVTGNSAVTGGVWALLAGTVAALIQFFAGDLVAASGFGFSRWLGSCVDIIAIPALIPLLVYLLLFCFKIFTGTPGFTNFTLLWLIPGAAIRAVGNSPNDPVFLVLVPVLWIAIAVGIPFFINIILNSRVFIIVLSSLAILIIPFAAASAYWAFYSQKLTLGIIFLVVITIPMLASMIMSLVKEKI